MKTLLFIISITAAFLLAQKSKLQKKELPALAVCSATIDSVLEAGRVARLEAKFLQMQ